MRPITNLNSLSVKNYVPGSDTLAVIRELKKLGIIKGPKAKSKPTAKMIDDIKQESDMVGYVKTLEGQPGRQNPNIFSLRQIEPGMTQQQIEDLQKRNEAGVAALRAEIEQHRQEYLEPLSRLANLTSERFRGAQEPGAGQRPNPFIQSTSIEEIEPDIQEELFTESLNEGGPKYTPVTQTELFAGEESENVGIPTAPPNLQPREKVGGGGGKKKKTLILAPQDVSDELGLGKIPTMRNSDTTVENYYIALTDAGIGERDPDLKTKSAILSEIKALLQDAGKSILNN